VLVFVQGFGLWDRCCRLLSVLRRGSECEVQDMTCIEVGRRF